MGAEPIENSVKSLFSEIEQCVQNRPEVICVYVFGSTIRNPETAGDLDIGVLSDTELTARGVVPPTVELFDDLKRQLGRTNIDVVPLNDAPHTLRHEVFSTGRCVYARDQNERFDFESRAEMAYYDYLPLKRIFDRATLQHALAEPHDTE